MFEKRIAVKPFCMNQGEPAMRYSRIFQICMGLYSAAIPAASAEASNESTKPNILVFIADDASPGSS